MKDSMILRIVYIFLLVFMLSTSTKCFSQSSTISFIDQKGSWFYVYDQNGKKTYTFSASSCELVGYGSDWYIVKKGSWYYVYDMKGRKINTISATNGEIIRVNAETYIIKRGSWLYTYNKYGKKLSTRSA